MQRRAGGKKRVMIRDTMIMGRSKKTLCPSRAQPQRFYFKYGRLKKIVGHNYRRQLEEKISSAINKTKPVFRYSIYFERKKNTLIKERKKGRGKFQSKNGRA